MNLANEMVVVDVAGVQKALRCMEDGPGGVIVDADGKGQMLLTHRDAPAFHGPVQVAVSLDGLPRKGGDFHMIPCTGMEHAFDVVAAEWKKRHGETWEQCNRACAEDVGAEPDDYADDRSWFLETVANHGLMIFRRKGLGTWSHGADCMVA